MPSTLIESMRQDKKSKGPELRFVLVSEIGTVEWMTVDDPALISAALHDVIGR